MMNTLKKLLDEKARIKVEFDTLLERYRIRVTGKSAFPESEREEMLALLDEKATQLGTVCDKINELEKTQGIN